MSEAAGAERTIVRSGKTDQSSNPPAKPASDASNRIAELQVSAHLMTLETGLFCIFQTPGSPLSNPATGLPGVRITPAPGLAGRPEAVSVSTFREDGWLNGTAALVRVTDGSAQILVTIYQQKGTDAAPRLQVLRLNGEPTTGSAIDTAVVAPLPGPARATGLAIARPESVAPPANPDVMAHIQRMGDVGCSLGEWLGSRGSRNWVEGFGLAPLEGVPASELEYQAVLGRNWLSPWVEAGKFCGSRGMALPLLGLKVRLKGTAAKMFECSYAATFVDGSAAGPCNSGETCESESLAALETLQIVIKTRDGEAAPAGPDAEPTDPAMNKPAGKKLSGDKPADPKLTKPSLRTRAKT